MRYVLFGGANYYPTGGAADFLCAYDNLEDAKDGARYYLGKTVPRANQDDVDIEWAHVAERKPDRTCLVVWRVSVGG